MCRECIFQRSYYYLYITLTQQLINDGYKRKTWSRSVFHVLLHEGLNDKPSATHESN
jgi:hypothetical protein